MQLFHHFRYWGFHQRIFITAVDSVSEPWTNRKKTCMCLRVYSYQWNQTYHDTPTDSDFEHWLIKSDINDFWKEFPIVGVHLGIPCQEYNQQHALGRLQVGGYTNETKGKNHLLHPRFTVSSWVISAERNVTYFKTTKNDWDGTWALSYSCTDSCHWCSPKIITHVTPLLFWFWRKACKHLKAWHRANGWSVSQTVGLREAYVSRIR